MTCEPYCILPPDHDGFCADHDPENPPPCRCGAQDDEPCRDPGSERGCD